MYGQQIATLDRTLQEVRRRSAAARDALLPGWRRVALAWRRKPLDAAKIQAEAVELEQALAAMREEAAAINEDAWGADKAYAQVLLRTIAAHLDVASLMVRIAGELAGGRAQGRPARRALRSDFAALGASQSGLGVLERELDAKWGLYLPVMFDDFLSGRDDPMVQRAKLVVQTAELNAVSIFAPLANEFATLRDADTNHWDYIATVAGVLFAMIRLGEARLGRSRQQKLVGVIQSELIRRFGDKAIQAVEHCGSNLTSYTRLSTGKGPRSPVMIYDGIGFWIVWNLLGRWPQKRDELQLVRAVGTLTGKPWTDWWQSDGTTK